MRSANNAENQRARLLEWLKKRPITTLEARHQLDILGVAPRIYELRHWFGKNIQTSWITDNNPGGGRHKVASYALLKGKWTGALMTKPNTSPKHIPIHLEKALSNLKPKESLGQKRKKALNVNSIAPYRTKPRPELREVM